MKNKLKYNFLHIIPLHYSTFYNGFLLCCSLSCHFFLLYRVFNKGNGKPFYQEEEKIEKTHLTL